MANHPIMRRLFHWWFLFKRPMTLGVRVVVENNKKQILLVRHTYVSGWHLPGGGVEVGETMDISARKEVLEETGIELNGELELFGIYFNRHASRRDHVGLFRAMAIGQEVQFASSREIAEARFFDRSNLPSETTKGTLKRIREIYEKEPQSRDW